MTWCGLSAALLLLALDTTTSRAWARADLAPVDSHPLSMGTGLLALERDRLLVWDVHGRAEIREADGTWTKEFQLPVDGILHVTRDGAGFLIDGSDRSNPSSRFVVLLDAHGKEQRRWAIPDNSWLISVPGVRRVAVCNGLIPLHDDGTQGPPEHFPWDNPFGCCLYPVLSVVGDATIVCRAPLLPSMQCDGFRASCERVGAGGWRVEGMGFQMCGPWLLEIGTHEVLVRSAATGKTKARVRLSKSLEFACARSDLLLIDGKRLSLVSLPSLRRIQTITFAGLPVADLVVGDSYIAYIKIRASHAVVHTLPFRSTP